METSNLNLLPKLVDGFTSNILAYAILLAAIATITMALLELVKAVFYLRLLYHHLMIRRWLRKDSACYNQLVFLAVGENDSSSALFDQPTDKLMAQVQAASNVVFESPSSFPELYDFFTKGTDSYSTKDQLTDSIIWKQFTERTVDENNINDRNLLQQATKARTRLDHFVARKLDGFQTLTEYRWARFNQFVSIVGAIIFIIVLLCESGNYYSPVQIFFLSVFGGLIAPVAKDVVTALSNLRTK